MSAGGEHLLCRVGERLCALPIGHASETMRPLPVAPLPDVPAAVLGAAIVRGVVTPVLDLRRLLGDADARAPRRFVTLNLGGRRAALAVDAVVGVRALDPAALAGLPPLLREAGAAGVAAIGTLDAELLVVLEQARLVPDSAWRALAAAAEPPPTERS